MTYNVFGGTLNLTQLQLGNFLPCREAVGKYGIYLNNYMLLL